jgi:hypothetical protein
MLSKTHIFILVLIFAAFVIAQPPPSAPKTSAEKTKPFSWGSIKDLPSTNPFVSMEGRFSIGLSQRIQGYSGFSPKQSGVNAFGDKFNWKFDEGEVAVVYLEFPETDLKGTNEELEKYTKILKDNILLTSPNAKVRDEAFFKFNTLFPASKTTFELSDNKFLIQRTYLIKNRMYRMVASFQNQENEKFVNAVFDTFKIISQVDIDAEIHRKYEEMKPLPLPQTPKVVKETSDAQDDGLKGKVKKIVEEREEISEGRIELRKISHVYFYNESGNFIESDYYDWKGNPFEIVVYGYIDGKRVSTSKSTSYEYDPPPAAPSKPKFDDGNPVKPDNRYQRSYEYKYVNGNLVEEQLVSNSGKKGMRYVYNRKENQIETLVFTSEGELNQKYLATIDKNGNEIEEILFGLKNKDIYGDRKYRYNYEFDKQGNWIKMVATIETNENGVTSFKSAYVKYRTITYW